MNSCKLVPSLVSDSQNSFSTLTTSPVSLPQGVEQVNPIYLAMVDDSLPINDSYAGSTYEIESTCNSTSYEGVPEKIQIPKKRATSNVWKYFEVYTHSAYHHLVVCLICNAEVNYT